MTRLLASAFLLAPLGVACVGKSEPRPQTAVKAVRTAEATVLVAQPKFVPVGAGDVVQLVRSTLDDAGDTQRVLVYVGAEWCEPCTRFHKAVEAGSLDEELAGVLFLEFDSDRDRDRLTTAGYGGELIPRFVRPGLDGRPSNQRIEGGIKGEGAARHIMERLRALLPPAK